jgi:hypothetical protein
MPVTFAEDATAEEAKADVARVLLPGTEQGHAPGAVGVDAVVPDRVALHD